jgi:LacI family transcriptional regulator
MGITIKKIATDLGLAVSTVSKALGDSHEISQDTKKRVLEYVKKLDYVPNANASSLKKRKTGNIAVVVPEVADSYFSTAINGIEAVAQIKGYHVIIYITHEDQLKEQSILQQFKSGRVDGVLMSASSGKKITSHVQELLASKIPLVFFDRVCDEVKVPMVLTNDFDSSYRATELLIKKGCRGIAFLQMAENLHIIQERLNGYKKALQDNRIKTKKEYIVRCTSHDTLNHPLIKKLLTLDNRPQGIVGSTEKLATLSYTVCYELGLRIPADIKVVGFSSMGIASLLNPSLTTVTQPAFEMGKAAATILFKLLNGKKIEVENEKIVLASTLYERASTG